MNKAGKVQTPALAILWLFYYISFKNQASTNSLYLDPEIHKTPTRSEKWLDM